MAVDQQQPVAVEAILAKNTVKRAIYIGPAMAVLFGIFSGWLGFWSAALGVGVVVINFLLAGAILSISARVSLSVYHAAALFGFFLRLGLITLTLFVLLRYVEIDRLAFGISAATAYTTLLAFETIAVAKGRERNLDWTR